MTDKTTHDILTLFALVIFADKRVFAREIEAFVDICVNTLSRNKHLKEMDEAEVLLWYEENRAEMKRYLDAPDFEEKFTALLDRLHPIPGKSEVLAAMNYIAASDGEVHVSETALIVLARRHWSAAPA